MRILLVDDDAALLELLSQALVRDGHEVYLCASGEQAVLLVHDETPDIAVLDLGLPGMSGDELISRLRRERQSLAILVLTAQNAVRAKVRCLDEGADDFLTKPFAVAELRARVRALGRRMPRASAKARYVGEGCELDFLARRAWKQGKAAPITSREWEILELLASRVGEVVTRKEIIARLWSQPDDASSAASLEVLIGRIRRKLMPSLIRTIRGEGYLLERGTNP